MTVAQAISLARAEIGFAPTMSAEEDKLSKFTVAKVMSDFYREFKPTSQRFTIEPQDREAAVPKGVEVQTLYHCGVDITPHQCRPEDLPIEG